MDRRVKYTKKIIKDTFLDLLQKKDITKVTVSELCEIADINRATFYRYYLDIFDLLDRLEEEFVSDLQNSYKDYNFTDNQLYDYVLALLKTCENNKSFVKVLFRTKNSINFLNNILEDSYLRCKEKWENDVEEINQLDEEYATAFLFNGCIGVVNYWIENDFSEDIEEIANIVKTLSYYGTNKFIYKK